MWGNQLVNYIVGVSLILLGLEDIRNGEIHAAILVGLIYLSVIYSIPNNTMMELGIGMLPGMILCILSAAIPTCLGMADGMLTVCYGLIYGWQKVCVLLMMGFWLAAMIGVVLSLVKKRNNIKMPFIPFLALVHIGMCI